MKTARAFALLPVLAFSCTIAAAQATTSSATQTAPMVTLRAQPPLSPGVEAFPRLAPGAGVSAEIVLKIDAALARQDRKAAAAALSCRQSFFEFQHKHEKDAWERSIAVTMAGPHYLSLLATDSYYCGGAYPNDGLLLPLVYDLTTGRPVDWVKLFPPGATGALDTAADGTQMGLIVWPWLSARAAKEADDSCKDAFTGDQPVSFGVWLNASGAEIVAQPLDFAHAIQGCANTVEISAAEARKLGFSGELLDALTHAAVGQTSPQR